jgi:hypothetical protein
MNHRQTRLFNVLTVLVVTVSIGLWPGAASAQSSDSIPPNKVVTGTFPEVNDLPVRTEMPEALVMNDGTRVTTVKKWRQRREEMKQILEYYELGHAPPPPGNVTGQDIKSLALLDGTVKYRLVHLKFGPGENWDSTSRFSRRPRADRSRPSSTRRSSAPRAWPSPIRPPQPPPIHRP